MLVERILFPGIRTWWHKSQSFEHRNASWSSDVLAIGVGQCVVMVKAKGLLVGMWLVWQAHAVNVLGVRVERKVIKIRPYAVVVCMGLWLAESSSE